MEYILKSTLLLSLFYLFYVFFLQKQTFFQWIRVFFLAGIAFAFIIPLIKITQFVKTDVIQSGLLSSFTNEELANGIISNTASTIDVYQLLLTIYILGVAFMFVRFITQMISFIWLILHAEQTKFEDYTLVLTHKKIVAFSFFKYIVINKGLLESDDSQYILQHEKTHIAQNHSIDTILNQMLVAFQWFNPLAWLYKKKAEINLEYIADHTVQNQVSDTKAYQLLLVKTAVPEYQMVLANNFNTSLIKNRIVMLHKNPTQASQKWKYLLLLPVILIFMYAFNRVEVPIYESADPYLYDIEKGLDLVVTINKDSNDKDLESIKDVFKQQGATITIKKVKRNNEDEITGISIKAKTAKTNTSFASDSEEPIHPITIKYKSKLNSIHILSNPHAEKDMFFFSHDGLHKDKRIEILKGHDKDFDMDLDIEMDGDDLIFIDEDRTKTTVNKDKNLFIIKEDVDEKDGEKKIFIKILEDEEDGDKPVKKKIIKKWHKKSDDFKTIDIIEGEDGETKFIVNGKEVSKEELEKMENEDIKELKIIKKKKVKE